MTVGAMLTRDRHSYAGFIFTACEDNLSTRFEWFPPLGTFTNPELAVQSKGSIHVIDPAVSGIQDYQASLVLISFTDHEISPSSVRKL